MPEPVLSPEREKAELTKAGLPQTEKTYPRSLQGELDPCTVMRSHLEAETRRDNVTMT